MNNNICKSKQINEAIRNKPIMLKIIKNHYFHELYLNDILEFKKKLYKVHISNIKNSTFKLR